MKQIIQSYRTGHMELADVPAPACDDAGILVRTACSLVSAGTEKTLVDLARKSLVGKALARPDLARQVLGKLRKEGVKQTLEKVFTKLDTPIPLGYSCAGEVVAVGSAVTRFKVGDRVACGGAGYANHAELNYVPHNLAVPVPAGLDLEAAAFATVGAIAMQGVRQAGVELGHRVGVIGLGLLGQLTVQLLKAAGATVLGTDLAPARSELARQLGADLTAPGDQFAALARTISDGHGLDAVIITASTPSSDPVTLAGDACRYRGKVVVVGMVGMDIPRTEFYKKELDLRLSMSYGPGRYDPVYEEKGVDYPYALVRWTEGRNMQSFLELCAAGRIDPLRLVTHRFEFADALRAYALMDANAGEPYLGILLKYDLEREIARDIERLPAAPRKDAALRVGLVGAGNFARGVLLPRLAALPDLRFEAIATATGISARNTGEKYRIPRLLADSAAVIADPTVNTVIITTRHDHHAAATLAALQAGKHVFVEKPLCIREDDLAAIEQAYTAADPRPVLMVGYNRRFSAHAARLRAWIAATSERPVIRYRINAGSIPRTHWVQDPERGGGRVLGEVCHFVDLCAFLADSPIAEVYATALDTPGDDAGDSVCIILKHQNGARSTIDYLANGDPTLPKEFIEIFCARGIATCDDFILTRLTRGGKETKFHSRGADKGFDNELDAFRRATLGIAPAPIPFDSLLNTSRTTFRILESIATGAAVRV